MSTNLKETLLNYVLSTVVLTVESIPNHSCVLGVEPADYPLIYTHLQCTELPTPGLGAQV